MRNFHNRVLHSKGDKVMKKLIFCAALLFCLYCLVPFQANAQQTFGYSQVGYDDITNTVYGSSTTIVDYIGAFHYRAYVEGYLYDQSGNLLDSGYDEGYFIAEVLTIAPRLSAHSVHAIQRSLSCCSLLYHG